MGTTKVNFLVQIKIISIEAKVKEPTIFTVIWKRGPSTEETTQVELDHRVGIIPVNQ
jgi:hypothetical protein